MNNLVFEVELQQSSVYKMVVIQCLLEWISIVYCFLYNYKSVANDYPMILILRHSTQQSNYLAVCKIISCKNSAKPVLQMNTFFLLDNLSQNYPSSRYVITEFFVIFVQSWRKKLNFVPLGIKFQRCHPKVYQKCEASCFEVRSKAKIKWFG